MLEKSRVAFALSGYARVQRDIGLFEHFIEGNEESAELLTELARESDYRELLWKALAQDYTYYLLWKGYFELGFVNFCTMHELCGQ